MSLRAGVDKDREPEQGRSQSMILEDLEKRIDELARNHAARHDEDVKAELEKLRKQVAKMERAATLGYGLLGPLRFVKA